MFKKLFVGACLLAAAFTTYSQTPIRSVGVGKNYEEAKNESFRKAIEYQIGTVIVSNFEVEKSAVVRNEILAYSSGYVDNFKIISEEQVGRNVQVVIDVYVSTSKIANRILSSNDGHKPLNGHVLSEQQKSYLDAKNRGDYLLKTTLDKYPEYAYNVRLLKTDLTHDSHRRMYLNVHYSLEFNQNWVESFRETMTAIGDRFDRRFRAESMILLHDRPYAVMEVNRWSHYQFNDYVSYGNIKRVIEKDLPFIRVQLMNGSYPIETKCFYTATHLFYNVHTQYRGVSAMTIFTQSETKNAVQIYINNPDDLNRVTEIKLDIVKRHGC